LWSLFSAFVWFAGLAVPGKPAKSDKKKDTRAAIVQNLAGIFRFEGIFRETSFFALLVFFVKIGKIFGEIAVFCRKWRIRYAQQK